MGTAAQAGGRIGETVQAQRPRGTSTQMISSILLLPNGK
jgi:hypothetical protein